MLRSRRLLKYALFGTAAVGTFTSYKANQYHIDAIGIMRFGRAALTAVEVSMLYQFNLYSSGLQPGTKEYAVRKSETHKKGAEKLLKLFCANKGVFVKVGQHIGALDYLVPQEYVETMRVLHSKAPTSPLNEIFMVIKEDLKKDPEDIFSEFDEKPLGAASLAQVHKAKLKDGRVVAVKVQHAFVKGNSLVDMKTMEVLIKMVSWVFPDFKFQWLVEESKKNIPRELNFELEAKNTKKAKEMFKHLPWLKIPEVYDDLSSRRVITMEFVEGGQVNDKEYLSKNRIDPFDVSDKLGRLYSEMIFGKGFVHSDPHPGNILVKRLSKDKAQIILLDHGLYAEISDRVRTEYSQLWMSILDQDKVGMQRHCEALGVGPLYDLFSCMVSGRTWDAINCGVVVTRRDAKEIETFERDFPLVLNKITETLDLVNREMLLILKTNDLIRGIEFSLNTQYRMSSYFVMSKFCVKSIYAEQIKRSSTATSKAVRFIAEQWTLLKLNVYYLFLSLKTLSFRHYMNMAFLS